MSRGNESGSNPDESRSDGSPKDDKQYSDQGEKSQSEDLERGTWDWYEEENFKPPNSYNKLPLRSKMLRKYRAESHGYP
jgi:hypothetical protein